MSSEGFWQIFDEQLEVIDGVLADRGTPIFRRPWEAAFFFLEHCVIEISGMDKKEVITHPIFRDMVQRSRDWYVQRFGEDLVQKDSDDAIAMAVLWDTPFELRFSLTITRPARQKGLTALHFARGVHRNEDSLSFLLHPPNLRDLSARERKVIRRRISRVVGLVRSLNANLMFTELGKGDGRALASGIRVSLEKGVQDICSGDSDRLSTAVWEFNFAAEKALKTFLWQRSAPVPRTHDIKGLLDQAVGRGLPKPPARWCSVFPSGVGAVRYRYGEMRSPSIGPLADLYTVALRLSVHCAGALKRYLSMGPRGAVFYLKSLWD